MSTDPRDCNGITGIVEALKDPNGMRQPVQYECLGNGIVVQGGVIEYTITPDDPEET